MQCKSLHQLGNIATFMGENQVTSSREKLTGYPLLNPTLHIRQQLIYHRHTSRVKRIMYMPPLKNLTDNNLDMSYFKISSSPRP